MRQNMHTTPRAQRYLVKRTARSQKPGNKEVLPSLLTPASAELHR
jgi:hypothetical protein